MADDRNLSVVEEPQTNDGSPERSNKPSDTSAVERISRESTDTRAADSASWSPSAIGSKLQENWTKVVDKDPSGRELLHTSRNGELDAGKPAYIFKDPNLPFHRETTTPAGSPDTGRDGRVAPTTAAGGESLNGAMGRSGARTADTVALGRGPVPEALPGRSDRVSEARDGSDRGGHSASLEASRENLRQSLESHGMSAAHVREVMSNMAKMEEHLQKNPPKSVDGHLDPVKESIRSYDAMARIANGEGERSSNGIRFASNDATNNHRVMETVRDGANRLGDQEHGHNQGPNNTCALQADQRQESYVSPATYAERLASLTNTGKFTDMRGRETVVDKASLCNFDSQAANFVPGQGRGPAGKVMDLGNGQWVQNHLSGTFGSSQALTYKQGSPSGRGDTGERVVQNATGNVIDDNPRADGNAVSAMKQQLYGDRLDPNFGKLNMLTNGTAFRGNFSSFTDPKAYTEAIQANESKGWGYSTAAVHTGNWNTDGSNGGDGGWHAISVSIAKGADGKAKIGSDGLAMVHETNNWDGKFQKDRTATEALNDGKGAWNSNGSGGSDHRFDHGKQSDLDPKADKGNNDRNKDDKDKDKDKEKDGKGEKTEDKLLAQLRKNQKAAAGAAAVNAQIASLQAQLERYKDDNSRRDQISNEINSLRTRTNTEDV